MKNFWKVINKELGFVFVSGLPNDVFKDLINYMDSDLMHFVPAIDEQAALGLATGAFISGFKSILMLTSDRLANIDYQFEEVNLNGNLPLIILTDEKVNFKGLKQFELDGSFQEINDYVYNEAKSVIVSLR